MDPWDAESCNKPKISHISLEGSAALISRRQPRFLFLGPFFLINSTFLGRNQLPEKIEKSTDAAYERLALESILIGGAVVVAQLLERSLPIPEIRGLTPNIGKVLSTNGN